MSNNEALQLVHRLRALTVSLDLLGAEFAASNGLHATDLRALICLLDAERAGLPATPGWLGSQLRINSASVTALVDRMEAAGHVRRDRDEADRRRINLSVTPAAVKLGWSFFGPLIDRSVEAMKSFDDAERSTITRFLDEMQRALP